jgi:anti-sigma factor RsiW
MSGTDACTTCRLLLPVVVADEAEPAQVEMVLRHTGTCDACRMEWKALRRAHESVARLAGTFAEAVAATNGLELHVKGETARSARRWPVAAAIVLSFAAGYALRAMHTGTPEAPRTIVPPSKVVTTPRDTYVRLAASAPNLSSLGRGLLSVAKP